MTWKEFKDKVESQGVKDDYEIRYIDCTCEAEVEIENNEDYLGKKIFTVS